MRSFMIGLFFLVCGGSFAGEIVSFKTSDHRYLVAEGGGGGEVNANRIEIGAWEKFNVVHLTGSNFSHGSRICIQASSGHFLSADNYDLVANRPYCLSWEEFEVVRLGNQIALKTHQNRYVVAHDGWVLADRIQIGEWEKFSVIKQ